MSRWFIAFAGAILVTAPAAILSGQETSTPGENKAQVKKVPAPSPVQKVLATPAQCRVIPTFFMRLERSVALLTMNPDPLFDVHDAAEIVGLSRNSLDKRRQRGQLPNYIQYDSHSGGPGPVRYALSALMKFREDHIIYPSRKK